MTRIVDNGRGIPAKLRRKIFGRFVRLGSELERSQTGTGLGLFIVRTLVKRLHGKIAVRDRGSQPGTIFEVQLPARRPCRRRDRPSDRSRSRHRGACPTLAIKTRPMAMRAADSQYAMKHILVVEDEQHLAFGIKYNLEAEGYEVTTAGDGPTALQAASKRIRTASTW